MAKKRRLLKRVDKTPIKKGYEKSTTESKIPSFKKPVRGNHFSNAPNYPLTIVRQAHQPYFDNRSLSLSKGTRR